jgi:hypothetical protein
MYYFIFYFVYKRSINKDGVFVARYSASLIVAIAMGIHIMLLYAIARFGLCYFWGISIARTNIHATLGNNLSYLLFFISILIPSYLYFNQRRVEITTNHFKVNENFYSGINIIKFITLFLLPLLAAIFLVNKSVYYCNAH